MSRVAYVDGRWTPHAHAHVHIEDRGFQFADGIYEVWSVFGGRLGDEEGHFARLERSLSELRIDMPMSRGALEAVLYETIRRNRVREGVVYLQVTRGAARRDHVFPSAETRPTVVVTARAIDWAAADARAAKGVAVVTTPETRWARCDIKSVGLLPNVLAKQAAKETSKRAAAAEKEAERKEALARDAAARKVAEAKTRKDAAVKDDEKPRHVRPGQVAKADEKKADPKAEAKAKADAKAAEAKAEAKAAAKAEAAQKLAEAKAAKEAAQKAAAAEKTEKVAAKEAPKPVAAAAPQAKSEPAAPAPVADATPSESFRWPAKGRVIAGYGSSGNEGINIAVPEGTPVKAAEEGTVAYAGSDVKGYGKLVLVRHANGYVSAYAHNGEIDVKPGEKVKRGQTIAKSGASGNVTSPQLHFEIRKGGSPVDPMSQLASN